MSNIPQPSSSSSSSSPNLHTVLFARGVIARLDIWSTLRIAVQENWGGPETKQKSRWIASAVVDSFEEESEEPDDIYIEDMLLQIMADEFEVSLEDGSAESVAKDIVRMWIETKEGREDSVRKFEDLAEKMKGKRIEVQETVASDDDEDWEDDEDDKESDDEAPQLIRHSSAQPTKEPEVDEDGFTLVKGRGKGQR
jgi:pre-rRNA-processing protein TSR2